MEKKHTHTGEKIIAKSCGSFLVETSEHNNSCFNDDDKKNLEIS